METRQLEYFLTLAKEEHVSSAASILNISQPALSKSLAKLEEEVGTRLFDRHGNSIRLNDHGRNFARYAQECIDTLNMGLMTTRRGRYDILGEVTIITHAFTDALTDCIIAYKDLNPYISFTLITADDSHEEMTGNYDFIWGSNQEPVLLSEQNQVWFGDPLFEDPLGLLISPTLRWYPPDTQSVSLKDFQEIPFINAPKFTLFFSDITTKLCLAAGFTPLIYCSTYDFLMSTHIIREAKAVGIFNRCCAKSAKEFAPELQFFNIKETSITRTLYLIHRDRALMSEAALDFLDFAIDYYLPEHAAESQANALTVR